MAKDLLVGKKIDSPKNISKAKKVHSILGPFYGMLSDLVHIGKMHIVPSGSKNPFCIGGQYDEDDQQYKPMVLSMILTGAEILNSFIEKVFFNKIENKRFWESNGKGLKRYKPIESIEGRQRSMLKNMERFFET